MNKLFVFTFLIFAFCGITNAQQPLSYSETIQVDSMSKKVLFTKVKNWFAETYQLSKEVLRVEDSTSGELIGKSSFTYNYETFLGYISYNIKVLVKDNKYKVEIYNFEQQCLGDFSYGLLSTETEFPRTPTNFAKKTYNKNWSDMKARSELEAKSLMNSLKEAIKKPAENW